jgi:DNA polymerase I-like protein with 3'-5' exonuclease and polymerase domains
VSDFFDSILTGISSSLDIKKTNNNTRILSPVLYKQDCEKINYTIIVDEYISNREIGLLRKILDKHITNYQILYALQLQLNEKDEKKTVWKTYRDYKWKFEEYIPQWSKIISFGKSMFSICESNDLDASVKWNEVDDEKEKDFEKLSIVAGFYDTLLSDTHFNDPRTKCIVFPVDSWYDIYNEESGLFYDKFEYWFFKEQLKKISNYDFKPVKIRNIKYIEVENPNEWLKEKIETVKQDSILDFDLETDSENDGKGTDPFDEKAFIINISFSFDGFTGYYLDWKKIDKNLVEQLLLKTYHIGSNISYDYKWLVIVGKLSLAIIKRIIGDTMHASQIYNTLQRTTLKAPVWICTWFGGYDQDLDKYKEKHPECKKHYSKIPKSILIPYASLDPCMSILVHNYFEKRIKEIDYKYPITFVTDSKWSMWRFYSELRINTQKVFTKAEITGMEINWNKINQLSKYVRQEIREKKKQVKEMLGVGEDFNIDSNDQLGDRLQELGWNNYGLSKKGKYNCNDYTLTRWKEDGHKEAEIINEIHKLNTVYRTFIGSEEEGTGYYQYKKYDSKVHSTFGVGLNSTGRNNSKGPNLQNLKKHGYLALEMRDFFSVDDEENRALCEQDGASLQLRIEASLSGDKEMEKLFKNNVDMHSLTGHMLFSKGESFEEFCAKVKAKDHDYVEYRYSAKAPNFSLCFNSTALAFAKESLYTGPYKWSLAQAKSYVKLHNLEELVHDKYERLIENPNIHDTPDVFSYYWACGEDIREKWLNKYVGIKDFIQYKIKEAETYGACFTPYGFIRRIPWLVYSTGSEENKKRVKNNQNMSTNVGAQTVEWVMISKAMIAEDDCIEKNNFKSKVLGNVHDSIVGNFFYDEMYKIAKAGKESFCEDVPENKNIPYGIEFEAGVWGFGESFDLNELKDPIKVKEKIKINNAKQRSKMVAYEKI